MPGEFAKHGVMGHLKDCYKIVAMRWKKETGQGSKSLENFSKYNNLKTIGLSGSLLFMLLTLKWMNSCQLATTETRFESKQQCLSTDDDCNFSWPRKGLPCLKKAVVQLELYQKRR